MTDEDTSPAYFVVSDRKYQPSQLSYQIAQCDAGQIERAWKAIQYLAKLDKDHAQEANGQGFSKSDTKLGHNLALWPLARVMRREILMIQFLKLARKYRGQLPLSLLVDQPSQGTLI
jgi:hypothetical protein